MEIFVALLLQVIKTILLPRSADPNDLKSSILALWQDKKISTNVALERLKSDRRLAGVETRLLQGLLERGNNDKIGAINYVSN